MNSEKIIGHGISTELSPPFPCALQMLNLLNILVFRFVGEEGLTQVESDDLIGWLQVTLGNKIKAAKVRFFIYLSSAKNNTMVLFKVTNRLEAHPCVVTVQEMGAARHFIKTTLSNRPDEEKFQFLQTTLEINPKHPIIVKLHKLKGSEADIARLVAEQVTHHHLHFLNFDDAKFYFFFSSLTTR